MLYTLEVPQGLTLTDVIFLEKSRLADSPVKVKFLTKTMMISDINNNNTSTFVHIE